MRVRTLKTLRRDAERCATADAHSECEHLVERAVEAYRRRLCECRGPERYDGSSHRKPGKRNHKLRELERRGAGFHAQPPPEPHKSPQGRSGELRAVLTCWLRRLFLMHPRRAIAVSDLGVALERQVGAARLV
jgi:hypothetical protein